MCRTPCNLTACELVALMIILSRQMCGALSKLHEGQQSARPAYLRVSDANVHKVKHSTLSSSATIVLLHCTARVVYQNQSELRQAKRTCC